MVPKCHLLLKHLSSFREIADSKCESGNIQDENFAVPKSKEIIKESFPKVKEPTGRSGYRPKFEMIWLVNITMSVTVPNILNMDIF